MKEFTCMALSALFFTFLVTYSLAAPPVEPPFEGFEIVTDTIIKCVGDVSEEENFSWHWNNDNADGIGGQAWGIDDGGPVPPLLFMGESEAKITYSEDFKSHNTFDLTGGDKDIRGDLITENGTQITKYDKSFNADSHPDEGVENLVVTKHVGYTSNGAEGSTATLDEVVSVEVVSAGGLAVGGGLTGVLSLCPWSVTSYSEFPATNEGIAMGAKFSIPNIGIDGNPGFISFDSETKANVTKYVSLAYEVLDTTRGSGTIQADMIARIYEGSDVTLVNLIAIPLNSQTVYTESAKATGLFEKFKKSFLYKSVFEQPSPEPLALDILQ